MEIVIAASERPPRAGRSAVLGLATLALSTGLLAVPALATSAPGLTGLNLQLKPSDVAAPAPPAPPTLSEPEGDQPPAVPEVVGQIDQMPRTNVPQKRNPGTGPLDTLSGSEGMLKELLENKTIPLFRITVPPPF